MVVRLLLTAIIISTPSPPPPAEPTRSPTQTVATVIQLARVRRCGTNLLTPLPFSQQMPGPSTGSFSWDSRSPCSCSRVCSCGGCSGGCARRHAGSQRCPGGREWERLRARPFKYIPGKRFLKRSAVNQAVIASPGNISSGSKSRLRRIES